MSVSKLTMADGSEFTRADLAALLELMAPGFRSFPESNLIFSAARLLRGQQNSFADSLIFVRSPLAKVHIERLGHGHPRPSDHPLAPADVRAILLAALDHPALQPGWLA